MASPDKKLVVVTGATGAQGGSVARTLAADPRYRVRGITRNLNAEKVKELNALGVEMVQGNLSDGAEALARLFEGAYAVFGVTNFWDPSIFMGDHSLEIRQGKSIVDAAVLAGVKHLIFSSLDDTASVSGNRLHVVHFSNKYKVEEYARQIKQQHPEMRVTFTYAGFYSSNFRTFFQLNQDQQGQYLMTLPFNGTVQLPFVDTEADFGPVVHGILANPEKYDNQKVYVAGEYLAVEEACKVLSEIFGRPVLFNKVDHETYRKLAGTELDEMMSWFEEFGYYNGADISATKQLHPGIRGFREAIVASGWKGESAHH